MKLCIMDIIDVIDDVSGSAAKIVSYVMGRCHYRIVDCVMTIIGWNDVWHGHRDWQWGFVVW